MAFSNSDSVITHYIRDIKDFIQIRNFTDMNKIMMDLTKYLFNHPDLIYSSINDEFEKSGLVEIMIETFPNLNEQFKRDNLRLLNIFLRTNNNLRNEVSKNRRFIEFLLSKISNREVWNNIERIKYFVNIVSYLLSTKEVNEKFETESIRNIVRSILNDFNMTETDNKRILCMIFYSSVDHNGKATSEDARGLCSNGRVCSKVIIDFFVELIRDYIYEFKPFYENPTNERSKYLKYGLKVDYSFDQLCHCLCYFARLDENIRQNIYQSGLYELLSYIFLIKGVPAVFMNSAIEVFTIPCMDNYLKEKFKIEHRNIIDKFKSFHSSDDCTAKHSIEGLLSNYENNTISLSKSLSHRYCQTDMLISFTPPTSTCFSHINEIWGSLDVENWLTDNNLEHCRDTFSPLTGRGLNQLKLLMNESGGRFQLLELLTQKLEMNLINALELLGALEDFEYK